MSIVGVLSLICIAGAGAILLRQIITRPSFDLRNKLWLALGFGALPLMAAGLTTANGLHVTTQRTFCGDCHVMEMHVADAEDRASNSLAARHARNPFFGDRNCYVCHADYGMLGYPLTKLNGMKHVWHYYTGGFLEQTAHEALPRLELYEPYDNENCRQCHSGLLEEWTRVPEHRSLEEPLGRNDVSCASGGCHGFAHPFSKLAQPSGGQTPEPAGEFTHGR